MRISDIRFGISIDHLRRVVQQYGEVEKVGMYLGADRKTYGFAMYIKPECAQEAIRKLPTAWHAAVRQAIPRYRMAPNCVYPCEE